MQQAQYDYQQALPQYQQQQQQQQHNQGRGGYNRGRAQGGRAAYRGGRGTGQHHTQLNASAAPYQMHDVYAVTGAGIGAAAPPPYAYMAGGGMDSGAAGYFQGDQQMVSLFGNPAAPITAFVPPQPQVQLDENSTEFCKALAKVAKPCPPWSIGSKPTESLAEEVARLDAFIAPQQQDSSDSSELWDSLRKAATANCPGTTLQYLGSNSWGFFPYKARLNIALLGFPDDDTTTAAFSRSLFSNGFAVESDVRDGSGARCLLVNHSVTKRIAVVRFGAATAAQARTVDVIRQCPRLASVRQSLNCLIVLLRQSKIIDDVDGAAFSDEAAAVMLLSIANSYPELPPSDRIIIDFFLTFGFKEHFGTDRFSVDMGGMVTPVAKVHTDAALSVIDPGDHTRNLTGGVTDHKLTFARSSFEYCYHVVSEFTKEANPHNRRGQSPLSTMIGGEPYWPRVVELAKQHVEPYHSFLASQKQTIFDEMMRASTRRSTRR